MPTTSGGQTYADLIRPRAQQYALSGSGLGRTPHSSPTRIGADALPSRDLGGQTPVTLADKLNPTNRDQYRTDNPVGSIPPDFMNPMWSEPSYQGSGQSHLRTMQSMADRQIEERERAGRQYLSQVSAGSHTPILYPIGYGASSPYIDYATEAMGSPIDPNAGAMSGPAPDDSVMELLRAILSQWSGR